MRNLLLGAALLVVALGTGACETDDAADPVPTMSVAPSTASSPAETASGFEVDPSPTDEPTSKESATEKGSADKGSAEPEPASGDATASSAAPAEPDLGRAPSSYDEAVGYVDLARAQGSSKEMQFFATPDDIYCVLDSQWLDPTCELPQGAGIQDARACRDAMGDKVGRIEVRGRGPVAVCNTDTIREALPEVVAPVAVVTHSGFSCAVAAIGVTCVGDGVGFFLGMDSYATFG